MVKVRHVDDATDDIEIIATYNKNNQDEIISRFYTYFSNQSPSRRPHHSKSRKWQ